MSNIQDFGEKIGGARKDLYALKRELRLEDIVDWSEYDREKYITKKEVFPLPDYKKLYEEGMNREVLFFIKEVRDALPTKPVVYIPYGCSDEEKEKLIHKAQEDYIMSIGCFYERSMQLKTISDCVDFYDSMRGENLPAIDWTNRKLKKAIRLDSTYRYHAFRSKMEEKQFLYTKEEKILSHYTIYQYDGKNVYRELYEKDRERLVIQQDRSKYYVYRTDENPSQWVEESYFALDNHTNQIVASNIANKELLQNTIIDLESNKADSEKEIRKKKKLVPVQLSHIRPTAEDYRKGINITGEDMLSVFQFRGGEFGNWESDNDRQTNLNMSYDALKDLAKALEIEDADISLGGQLAIAYGARGISSALAHFEPGTNVINLTKMKGAGALAHEWGHALDYYIASKKGNKVNYATERPTGKLKELLQIMKYNGSNRTQFYEDARHLDDSYTKSGHKGYWQSDVELFARAFASYIRDKLKPSNSDYLVGYSEMKGAYVKNGKIMEASSSPQGEERQRINAAMDALIGELKEQGILHHNEYSQDNLIENNQVSEITNEETIDIKKAEPLDNINYKMPPKQILKEGTSMDKLDKIISQYEDFLELFKAHTRNDFKDWQQKRGKQLRETLLNLKKELNANPDSVASLLPNFYEETNPDSLESHGLWNSAWSYIEEHSLAGTHSKEINEIINKPETKALALSIMQDIIDYTDGRLFYCSYIRNGVVINEDIMIHYLHQYGNHVQSMQDSTTSVYMENPETVHYSYQALLDYLKERDTLRFYINSKEGRTQYLTNDRMTSYLAALDEYLKLGDVQKSIEFSVDGKDFIELAQFSIENSENLDGETILKNIRKNDIDKLGVLHDHMKRLPRVEYMLRNMNDNFTFLLAHTNTQMRQAQKADIWKIRLAAPNNSNTYIELSVERTYKEPEPGEESHDQTLVTMHSFVNGIENDTGRIGFPTEKFLSNDPKYNIVEGEIFRGENEKYILRQMCKRLAFAMSEDDEPILYMTENLGEALEAFDAKALPETEISSVEVQANVETLQLNETAANFEVDNKSLEEIEDMYGSVDEYTRVMFEERNVETFEEDDLESVEVSEEEYEELRTKNPGLSQNEQSEKMNKKNDADQTFILTGAKVSLQMQDILRRLSSGENVSIEEINDTKEIRYCRSIADNGRETYLQDGRTDKQKQVIAYMESLGCASGRLDREGKMIYDGNVSRGSRLDIVIGLPGAGKSSSLVDIISQEFHSKVIDNDIAKEQFAEYQDGLGARLVHKESQMVCERVLENALAKHENIVLPKVGSNVNKLLDNIIASAKEQNYEVNVHFVDLERDKTLGRMLGRLISDGRFLDPALIDKYSPDKEHNRCERTYEVLKQNELISGYSRWDNDVEKGEKPFMVESHNLTGEYINNARLKENEKGVVDNGRIGLQHNGERRQRFSKDLGENGGTAKTSVRGVYEGSDKDNEGGRRELQERATEVELKPAEHLDENIIMEKPFAEQVDEVLAGTANQYNALKVCDTPQILVDVGCEQLPMLYTQQHLRDALKSKSSKNPHRHGLTVEQIKSIPDLIADPAIIFDSMTMHKNAEKSIVVVLKAFDNDKAPLIVSVAPNGKGLYNLEMIDSNFITSIYGKDRGFVNYIENAIKNGNVLYWNKSKSQELFMFQGLQLPEAFNNLDSDVIIRKSHNIVNPNEKEKSFAEQVDEVLAGNSNQYNALKVCDTPRLLLDVGCEQLPMLFTHKHLHNAIRPISDKNSKGHGLSIQQVKKLPELLENPVMIYDSQSQKNSIVVVTDELDARSFPVIVSIKTNGKGTYELQKVDSNFITSVYGRRNFDGHITDVVNNGDLLYWNKQKSQELFRVSRLQLPGCLNNLDFDKIIHQSNNIVNKKSSDYEEFAQKHKESMDAKVVNRIPIVINAFGGPGSGKSVSCMDICQQLKKLGYNAEYVQEYAKELVYAEDWETLDGSPQHQFEVLQEQLARVDRLYGKVDFIVTDSPILLNGVYNKELTPEYDQMVTSLYNDFENFTYFVERDASSYQQEGRIQNLEESQKIDKDIKDLLTDKNIYFGTYNHETIDKVVNNSIATYNRINHIEEPATKKQIAYAKKIAETLQIDMPEQNTRAAYNEFISSNQEKFKKTSTPISQNDTSYNLEYYMKLVSENGSKLSEVPQEFYTPELLLAAVNNWGAAIRMVPETLMTEELSLAAVKQYGMNLRSIPNELKNEDVCIEAYVSSGGKALRYVPADLKDVVKEHGNKTLLSSSDIPDEKRQIDVSDIQESGREWVSNIDNILKEHESNPEAMVEDIAFAAKFYKYSVKNIQLMLQQNQGITYVASSNAFSTMGYHVKEGEQPLVARVPVFSKYVLNEHGGKTYMNEYTEQIRQEIKNGNLKEYRFVRKFQFVAAFYDISQTDCPVEDYPSIYHMGIPSEFHQEAFEAMKQFAEDTLGFKVIVEDLKSISLYGSCDVKNKVIRINNRLESTQALSTLCHEIAHGILHSVDVHNKMTSAQKECEADVMSIMLETSLGLSISPARREHLYNHFHEYKDEQANKEHPYEVALEKLIDRVQSKVFKVYIDDINHYMDLHLPKNKDKTVNQKLIRDMANLDVAYDKHTSEFIIPDLTSSSQNQMNEYTESYRKISDEIRLNNSFVPKLGVIRKETTDSYETYELMDVQLLDDKIAKLLMRFPEQIRREYLSLDIPRGSILALKQNVMEKPIYYQVTENELIPLESSYAEQISKDLPESKINAGLTMQKEFESLQELYQAGVRLTEEQQQRYKHLNRYLGQQKSNYSSQEFMTRLNLMTQDLSVNNRELINEYVFRTGNFERAYKYCEQLEKEPGVVKKMLEELHAVDTLKYMLWTISEYEDATGVSSDKRITTGAYNNASLPVLTENVTSIQNITDAYKLIQKYEVMERFKNYAIVKQNDKFLLADVILDDYIPEIRLSDIKFDSESDAKLYYENELSGDKRNLLMGVEDLEVLLQKDSKDNAVYLDTFVRDEQIELYRELSQGKEPMVDAQDNVIDVTVEDNLCGLSERNEIDAKFEREQLEWEQTVEDFYEGKLDKSQMIKIGSTPVSLQICGSDQVDLYITHKTLENAIASKSEKISKHHSHGHNLDKKDLNEVLRDLRTPLLVIRTYKNNSDEFLVAAEHNNKEMVYAVSLNKGYYSLKINKINTFFSPDDFTNYIKYQLKYDDLVAINKKIDGFISQEGTSSSVVSINYDENIAYVRSDVKENLFKNREIVDEAAASLEQSEPSQEAFKSISESHVCQDKYAYVDFGNPEKTYLYTTDLIGNIWRNPITDESAYDLYSRLKKADYQVCMSFADFKALAHNQSIERFNNPMRQKEVYIRIIESNQEQLPKDSYMSVYDFKKNMDVLQMDTNAEKLDVTYKVITRHNREICSYINKIDNNDTEDVYLSIYNKVKEQDPDLCKKIAKQYYKDQIQFNEEHLLRPLMEFVNTQENDDQLLETAELLLDSNDALNKEIRKLDIAPADAEILKLQAGKIDSNKLMNIENQIQMNSQIKQKNQQTKKDISIAD